tara:strand:- start:1456 stop:1902 length:447 start_codon:yes stop_codon:yes gene_type:complete
MKVKIMMAFFWIVVAGFVGLQAYVRLAPTQVENWAIKDSPQEPGDYPTEGGFKVVRLVDGDGSDVVDAFGNAMLSLPRTQKLGQVRGQDVYVTRSLLWGFPDFTTIAREDAGAQTRVVIYGRLRFGKSDMGVNKNRLQRVLAGIGQIS